MKKQISLSLVFLLTLTLMACGGNTIGGKTVANQTTNIKIKLIFNNEEVMVSMYDNPTSQDFLQKLPMTITFEDYAGTEKISRLEKRLSIEAAPSGIDPSVGDFTYYSPWGNLAIFYQDFGYSSGLVKLGHIEVGVEKLVKMNGSFTMTIEQAQ
ncbi:cyclophilin-like fold protein [Paenibacillus sp. EKM212P]|uniref:cyclophilin-like fold protein n=1 Tax=Paenibacillus sp. EKM212P TaxID=1683680 RepID=UPI001EEA6C75|nr:cyclophilin-like fold protein [Paenibacillus sp. EKM212P]